MTVAIGAKRGERLKGEACDVVGYGKHYFGLFSILVGRDYTDGLRFAKYTLKEYP
jgi:hypothetical protein